LVLKQEVAGKRLDADGFCWSGSSESQQDVPTHITQEIWPNSSGVLKTGASAPNDVIIFISYNRTCGPE